MGRQNPSLMGEKASSPTVVMNVATPRDHATRPTRRKGLLVRQETGLDRAEASILELSWNFNAAPALDIRNVICVAEHHVNQVDQSHRDEARTRVVGFLSHLHHRRFTSPLSTDEHSAVKRLRENAAIAILPADKGNATVVLDTSVYKWKMLDLFQDQDMRLNRDPTLKAQKEL
ncbi:hypothetical protein HPB52_003754 [Rhipicephalus sanguineus]|uniref:Uncharacterized protein n=1 Tax=Rhipicephalus sanguineus TaxID=34632 RepID=A0A9D4PR42_RHISA|nr:hypothetical protein HPB52_003754 [Rhipicephalus sanguineus]